jgi:hypothetical protein
MENIYFICRIDPQTRAQQFQILVYFKKRSDCHCPSDRDRRNPWIHLSSSVRSLSWRNNGRRGKNSSGLGTRQISVKIQVPAPTAGLVEVKCLHFLICKMKVKSEVVVKLDCIRFEVCQALYWGPLKASLSVSLSLSLALSLSLWSHSPAMIYCVTTGPKQQGQSMTDL